MTKLGASHLDSEHADWSKVLPDGFDVVFDGIGELGFSRSWSALGPRGHLSAFGVSAGVKSNAPFLLLGLWLAKLWFWNAFSRGRSTSFFSITTSRKKHSDWFVADFGALLGLLTRGSIQPRIAERIPLDAVADAHTRIERGGIDGKIVLVPND